VFANFPKIIQLQIINYSNVVNKFAVLAHKGMSWFLVASQLIHLIWTQMFYTFLFLSILKWYFFNSFVHFTPFELKFLFFYLKFIAHWFKLVFSFLIFLFIESTHFLNKLFLNFLILFLTCHKILLFNHVLFFIKILLLLIIKIKIPFVFLNIIRIIWDNKKQRVIHQVKLSQERNILRNIFYDLIGF
jgi:hypothetical protein